MAVIDGPHFGSVVADGPLSMPRTDTLIVGAGQAGLALSRELTLAGRDHVLVERGRVGERWRARWASLTLLTPNRLSRLPGDAPPADPGGFMTRDELVARLDAYAASFAAPVVDRTRVLAVRRRGDGFVVDTDRGAWRARRVVVCTGAADRPQMPRVPGVVPRDVRSLHAAAYRSPAALPDGGVLVVGAGPTGQQIALELRRAGREVVLAAGRHARMVRRHRGIDAWAWLARIGELDRTIDEVPDPAAARRAASLVLTGARGGEHLDLGVLRDAGVVLTGRLLGCTGARARFAHDLRETAHAADARMRPLLVRFDAHAGARSAWPAPLLLDDGPAELDLRAAGVGTVLWATGFRRRYDWLPAGAAGPDGELVHRRGVTRVPGLLALGLPFQYRRDVAHDRRRRRGRRVPRRDDHWRTPAADRDGCLTSSSRKVSISTVTGSVSPSHGKWSSPSSSTKSASGMPSATWRPPSTEIIRSPRRWTTSVGARTEGSSGRRSMSRIASTVARPIDGLAPARGSDRRARG